MSSNDLNNLTVKELKELAKERELHGYSKSKKAELIELLEKYDENREYLPFDIVNYGIQGYLDYEKEIPQLEQIFGKKMEMTSRSR